MHEQVGDGAVEHGTLEAEVAGEGLVVGRGQAEGRGALGAGEGRDGLDLFLQVLDGPLSGAVEPGPDGAAVGDP